MFTVTTWHPFNRLLAAFIRQNILADHFSTLRNVRLFLRRQMLKVQRVRWNIASNCTKFRFVWGAWRGSQPTQAPHRCSKCNSPHINGQLVQTHAPSRALRSSDAPMLVVPPIHTELARRAFCCCSIHLELSACWHSTVRKHSHFQAPFKSPSILTHFVLLCCIKRLCIFGPKGAIQIRYYYYYYY